MAVYIELRLALSTAIHAIPNDPLSDEVLAVGDSAFRSRRRGRITQLMAHGRSIALVSRSLAEVKVLGQRPMLLEEGWSVTVGRMNRSSKV